MKQKLVHIQLVCLFCFTLLGINTQLVNAEDRLPNTGTWDFEGVPSSGMVEGIDRFLLSETEAALKNRTAHWNRDLSSVEAYQKSIEKNRTDLSWILGLRDERIPFESPEMIETLNNVAKIGTGPGFDVLRIRWPVLNGVAWEGLLLEPHEAPAAHVIAIPDAGQSPEMMIGLQPGIATESRFALQLAAQGIRVIIPAVISREVHTRRRAELTDREFVYRSSFNMGRQPLGYEIQAILAIVDWVATYTPKQNDTFKEKPYPLVGVIGWGEGGLLALMSAAVDPRIDAALVSGYFGSRLQTWQEPIDRNLFGILEQFGNAEIAALISPRRLIIEAAKGPEATFQTKNGAPGQLVSPKLQEVTQEFNLTKSLLKQGPLSKNLKLINSGKQPESYISSSTVAVFLKALQSSSQTKPEPASIKVEGKPVSKEITSQRQARLVDQLTQYNQELMERGADVRQEFFKDLDTSSLEAYNKTVEPYRDYFRKKVIGHFDQDLLEPKPRTRKILEHEKWTGYEVMLDVFPEVFAYGILLVPKDIKPGEKRPVVVCQHGLEGVPLDVIQKYHYAYHDSAAKLAEQGVITFSPQNPYIGKDLFRTLQRKANPLGKTLFSVIVPQHEQITRWLATLPQVDPKRIAFYGLSYGGKSAMRIPPLVSNYCLSICSADFNDWVRKNVSTNDNFSYIWTGEYEIFEFDLGSTFNYAEMASLIAPRPFMVERGHFDGVGTDFWVAAEFAKIRYQYQAKLGLIDKTEIEWFVGPHTINGEGTFKFLEKHLQHPIKSFSEE
ncbi:MAG: hypothetical protein JKY95_13695 [Planctomycetaceae bacterium]|nr:hypothetical protein [Planctomycetaceae bacterium]